MEGDPMDTHEDQPDTASDELAGLPAGPAPVTKTDLVKDWIRKHPDASIRDTVIATGVSRGLVSIARRQVAAETGAPPRPRTPTRTEAADPLAAGAPSTPASPEEIFGTIFEKVLAGEGRSVTPSQRHQILSEMFMHPGIQPQTRVQISNSISALEASAGSTGTLGPGPPQTAAEAVARLGRVMKACGHAIAKQAWHEAFRTYTPDKDPHAPSAEEAPASS